jgi:hypothetical protein
MIPRPGRTGKAMALQPLNPRPPAARQRRAPPDSAAQQPPGLPDALAAFAEVARPLMLQFMPPNSCVACARIAIEVLTRFGLRAYPLPVQFVCSNDRTAYMAGVDPPAHAIRLHDAELPWRGHVVVGVWREHEEDWWLIDPSFDQASAPDHGMPIPPTILVIAMTPDVEPRYAHVVAEFTNPRVNVEYMPLDDYSFTDSPAWERDYLLPVVQLICERMERSMNG